MSKEKDRSAENIAGDKNFTRPLVIASETLKGQVILPKALVL